MKKFLIFLVLAFSLLNANSLNEIRSSKTLRVGVYDAQPPFSQLKSSGEFEGFEIGFAKEIAKGIFGESGGNVEFKAVSANDRIKFLQDNSVDLVIATLTITDERAKLVDFSNPYFAVNIGVLTRKDDEIKEFSQLKNKIIITQKGGTAEDYFKNLGFLM